MNYECSKHDIITALATPYGKSAVAVIRVAGKGCIELVNGFLDKPLKAGRLEYNVFRSGSFKETMMAVCYVAPKSYSGEDTVELMPHGNMTVSDIIIDALVKGGARIAERGEFTERAFMNGKLDLTQCEALADIIDAETAEQLEYGNKRYDGGFDSLKKAETLLNRALSTVEAVIHYSDELEENETDSAIIDDVYKAVDEAAALLKKEIDGYAGGRILNDGFKIVLIGKPNVGKSTLLNALLGTDRAIVTDIAGTTRDTVDGSYVYRGRKFTVTDTAGLNDAACDEVEKIGIERAKKAAAAADAVIAVCTEAENEVAANVEAPIIRVINKCDGEKDVETDYKKAQGDGLLRISAKNGINITALKQMLYDLCPTAAGGICNHRQYECAVRCYSACEAARSERSKADGLEIVAAALYDAYNAIESLYGGQADEKVIASVFERFCVGK